MAALYVHFRTFTVSAGAGHPDLSGSIRCFRFPRSSRPIHPAMGIIHLFRGLRHPGQRPENNLGRRKHGYFGQQLFSRTGLDFNRAEKTFTLQYARRDLPQDRWNDVHVVRACMVIAVVWACLMTVSAVMSAVITQPHRPVARLGLFLHQHEQPGRRSKLYGVVQKTGAPARFRARAINAFLSLINTQSLKYQIHTITIRTNSLTSI